MGISNSINSVVNKIELSRKDISYTQTSLNIECNRASNWWNDKASEAFLEKHKQLNTTIKQLDRETYNLKRSLAELAIETDRADEKRRIAKVTKR